MSKLNNNFESFLKGHLVDLIVLDNNVIETTNWYRWLNDEEATSNMQKHYFPNTMDLQKKFFENNIEESHDKLQLGIYQKDIKLLTGVISLSDINYINRTTEIAVFIGEKKGRNLNCFNESVTLLLRHAFNTLNLNRVYSGSFVKEIDTLFCRTLGFTHEGISREAVFKNGNYHDVYHHSLLKEEFLERDSS